MNTEVSLSPEHLVLSWLLAVSRRADALSWGRAGSPGVDRVVWLQAEREHFEALRPGECDGPVNSRAAAENR